MVQKKLRPRYIMSCTNEKNQLRETRCIAATISFHYLLQTEEIFLANR
jgi:hypothetical protein